MDMPVQLAILFCNYAKLPHARVLLRFRVEYVDRADFEFLEMDTDSAYFALSAPKFADVVRPSLRQRFDDALMSHCSETIDRKLA